MKVILIIISILGLISCAPAPEKTKAKISFGAIATAEVFPGGLYILIHKPDPNGNEDRSIAQMTYINDTDFNIELENGEWEFGAIGWDMTSGKFQGEPKCFFSGKTRLDGGEKTINLEVSKQGCSNDPFYRDGYMNTSGAPRQTRLISCAGLIARDKNQNNTETNYDCDDYPGKHSSFRFVMHDIPMGPVIDMDKRKTKPQNSVCMNGLVDAHIGMNSVHMPIFEGIPQRIIAFEGTNCSGNSRVYNFPRGIYNSNVSNDSGFAIPNNINNSNDIYLNTAFCTAEDIASTTVIESGLGTEISPWVICTGAELGLMSNIISYGLDKHYILGRNITPISYSTPVATFTGSFDGGDKEIRNLAAPLFSNIGDGAKIQNFTLRNIAINSAPDINLGALSREVNGANISASIQNISLDNIDLSSFTASCSIGALIGSINVSGISKIKINEIDIFDNSLTSGNTISGSNACDIGGLIGKIVAGNSGDVEIEKIHLNNLVLSNQNASTSTGGIIGSATNTNLFHSHVGSAFISGEINVGGLIGLGVGTNIFASAFSSDSGLDTILECVLDNDDFTSPGSPSITPPDCANFGGIIGHANENNIINNTLSIFSMTDDNDIINDLGGVAGRMTSTTNFNKISNAGTILNININGSAHGGIVGVLNESVVLSDPYAHVLNSVALGHLGIHDALAGTHNQIKGGLVGLVNTNQGSMRGSIANLNLLGSEYIGGLVGQNFGSIRESVLFNSNIQADTQFEGQSFVVGGLVGQNGGSGFVHDSVAINSNINIFNNTNNCADVNTQFCGTIIGENLNPATQGNNSAANFVNFIGSNLLADGNGITTAIGGFNNNSQAFTTSMFPIDYTNPNNIAHAILVDDSYYTAGGVNRPWTFNGNFGHIPLFFDKHFSLGFIPDENRIKLGNIFERLSIRSVADWNSIQSDAYLLGKALGLGNDLDFSSQPFYPIGTHEDSGTIYCDTNTFYGALLGNDNIDANHSYRMIGVELGSNIDAASCSTRSIGIVSKLGVLASKIPAIIGSEKHPLIVDNLKFDLGNAQIQYIGSVAGQVNSGYVFARVYNSEIISTYTAGIDAGGIVGHSGSGGLVAIHDSHFSGIINTPGYLNLGGMIASVGGGGILSLNNNFVEVRDFDGWNIIGGLIGSTGSPSAINIENNIVTISNNAHLRANSGGGGESVAGAIGNYFSAPTEFINSNLVIYEGGASMISTQPTFAFTDNAISIGSGDFNTVIGIGSLGNANFQFEAYDDFLSSLGLSPFKGIYYDDQSNYLRQFWQHPNFAQSF